MGAFCVFKKGFFQMAAIDTARAIQSLLQEYGVDNDSLDSFIKEAEELPDARTLDTFNDLVEDYQNASGYSNIISTGEELLDFYNSHAEELSYKANEMAKLSNALEDFEEVHRLYEQLDSEIEDGEL